MSLILVFTGLFSAAVALIGYSIGLIGLILVKILAKVGKDQIR